MALNRQPYHESNYQRMKKNTSYGILEQARQAGLAKPSAGMTVPEGYFADFAERMSAQLPERPEAECVQAPPTVADKSLWQKVRPYVYMAAMFAGIWLMLQMFAMLGGQNRIGDIGDSKVLAEAMGDDDFVFDYFFSDKYSYEIVDEMALDEESLPEEMVFDDNFMYESSDSAAEKP